VERTFDSLGNIDLAKIIQGNKIVFGGEIMISPRMIRGFRVPERFEEQLRTFNEFLELYVPSLYSRRVLHAALSLKSL